MESLKLLLSSNTSNVSFKYCWLAAALPRVSSSCSRLHNASNESWNGGAISTHASSILRLFTSLTNFTIASGAASHPGHALILSTAASNARRLPQECRATLQSEENTNSLPPHAHVAPQLLPSGKFFPRTPLAGMRDGAAYAADAAAYAALGGVYACDGGKNLDGETKPSGFAGVTGGGWNLGWGARPAAAGSAGTAKSVGFATGDDCCPACRGGGSSGAAGGGKCCGCCSGAASQASSLTLSPSQLSAALPK